MKAMVSEKKIKSSKIYIKGERRGNKSHYRQFK